MDRLETAKLHKAIDQVLEDHVSMLKPTRVMVRELILDAIEGAELEIVPTSVLFEAADRVKRPHPLDYGKTAYQYAYGGEWFDVGTGPYPYSGEVYCAESSLVWRIKP